MRRLRGGSGLGDSVYLRPLAEHFAAQGDPVIVRSNYPDVFRGAECNVEPFGRDNVQIIGHYVMGKHTAGTSQWDDICVSARVSRVPLKFEWQVRNQALVDSVFVQADGRKVILVHGGRAPMARTDGFGAELLPEVHAFAAALTGLEAHFLVQVGKADQVYKLGTHLNLNGKTSVSDLLDLAWACDGWAAQCSFAIPLAECFDKPALFVWAHRGMSIGRHPYVSSITPQKVLSKPSSKFVVDDWPLEKIKESARAFCHV